MIEGQPYPPIAQVADQQSDYLANTVFNKNMVEGTTPGEFSYLHKGSMAQIGDGRAIMDVRNAGTNDVKGWMDAWNVNPKGGAAGLIYKNFYWAKAVSASNKLLIPAYWFKAKAFGRDISRF